MPTLNKTEEKRAISDIIAASQSITCCKNTLFELLLKHKATHLDDTPSSPISDDGFEFVTVSDHILVQPAHSNTENNISAPVISEDSFEHVDRAEDILPQCPLTNEGLIKLADLLEIHFNGLPEGTMSALSAARRNSLKRTPYSDNDSVIPEHTDEVEFAKRRLLAVLPTLITLPKSSNSTVNRIIAALNLWQAALYHEHKDDLEQILAATAFHYDRKTERLIIRHAPTYQKDDEQKNTALALQQTVTQIIRLHINTLTPNNSLTSTSVDTLESSTERTESSEISDKTSTIESKESQDTPDILHISPTIVTGFSSDHIVLKIKSDSQPSEVIFDPATSFSSKIAPNRYYQYLAVQKWTNNTDCGRYVTIMAALAFKLLAQDQNRSLEDLHIDNFKSNICVINASAFKTSESLKALLTTFELPNRQQQMLAAKEIIKTAKEQLADAGDTRARHISGFLGQTLQATVGFFSAGSSSSPTSSNSDLPSPAIQ